MNQIDATHSINNWLSNFENALTAHDSTAAAAMFDEESCFWRDLISFTWNIKTMEGRKEDWVDEVDKNYR